MISSVVSLAIFSGTRLLLTSTRPIIRNLLVSDQVLLFQSKHILFTNDFVNIGRKVYCSRS